MDRVTNVVTDRSWEFTPASLAQRQVRAARMLVVGTFGPPRGPGDPFSEGRAVVLDADSDEFVLVPGIPALVRARHMSLSDGGQRLIGVANLDNNRGNVLFVYTLATGDIRWMDRGVAEGHAMGTFSPDGSQVAALAMLPSSDPEAEQISIEVIDLDSGVVQTIWRGVGYWLECALAWSPDGELLVASYVEHHAPLNTTVVVEVASGREIARMTDRIPMPDPHAVWVSDREFIAFSEGDVDVAVVRVDAATGQVSEEFLSRPHLGHGGFVDGRYVGRSVRPQGNQVTELYTTSLNDDDPRLLLTITGAVQVSAVDAPPPVS